jgi:hypothetical protein
VAHDFKQAAVEKYCALLPVQAGMIVLQYSVHFGPLVQTARPVSQVYPAPVAQSPSPEQLVLQAFVPQT